jgi:hypothetical protein
MIDLASLIPSLGIEDNLKQAQHAYFAAGTVVFGTISGVAMIVSLLGILYMTLVIAPNATQRFSGALRERNFLSFFAGIPVFGVFAFLGAATQGAPVLQALIGVLFGVLLIMAYAAAAEDIGRRLYWACGKEGHRASHLATGWMVFAFGALFPVLGWFVILPYVSLSGLGSVVVGSFPARRPAPGGKDIEYPDDMTK